MPSNTDTGWFVIVGSFNKSDFRKAQERLTNAQQLGYEARIEDADQYPNLKSGLWVVVLGPYSKDAAKSIASEIGPKVPEGAYIKSGW